MSGSRVPSAPGRGPNCERLHAADLERMRAIAARVAEGADPLDAAWEVLSSRALGYERFRDAPRPSDTALRGKLAALGQRCAPQAVAQARAGALSMLSTMADDAARCVGDLVRGEFGEGRVTGAGEDRRVELDPHAARVRLEASRTVLRSIGVNEQGATSQTVNVGVSVSIGDGLRRLRVVESQVRDAPPPAAPAPDSEDGPGA